MDYTSIELIFENCESLVIPANFVNSLSLKDIKKHISINFIGQLNEWVVCTSCNIDLKQEIDELKVLPEVPGRKESVIKRLRQDDITSIIINTEKERLQVQVPWGETNSITNEYQYTLVGKKCKDIDRIRILYHTQYNV